MRFMKCLVVILFIFSCTSGPKTPDVSDIKVELTTKRFENDFFSLDKYTDIQQVESLIKKYPIFASDFFNTILNIDIASNSDSALHYINGYKQAYQTLKDTASLVFKDFTPYENEIKKSLQYLKYYFPNYHQPRTIITYVGPLDGYGDIISDDAIIIGLHHHLGANASFYKFGWVQETYPSYLTYNFDPPHIAINCMKNIIVDMYPSQYDEANLLTQMIESGKRLYLLQMLLPEKEEFRLIGYEETQMKQCYEHEAQIWDLFIQNNYLQSIDKNIIKNFIGESPKTIELGEASPGNIGSFVGWQIVKKYMIKKPETSLQHLMKLTDEEILDIAKYKP